MCNIWNIYYSIRIIYYSLLLYARQQQIQSTKQQKTQQNMKISKNQNTVVLEDKLYKAKEVTEEQVKEYPTLCNLCDLYSQDCNKAPCERSKRMDNKEIVFQYIRLIKPIEKK